MMGASASVDLVMGASVLLSWRSGFRLFFNLGLCVCGAVRGGRSVFIPPILKRATSLMKGQGAIGFTLTEASGAGGNRFSHPSDFETLMKPCALIK